MYMQFQKLLGWTMVVVSALGFVGVVNKPPPSPYGASVVLGLIALGGVSLLWKNRRTVVAAREVDLVVEKAVLKAARALAGRVTAAEVAADSGLSLHAVGEELARLERSGTCTSLVGESGILIYLFAEFENPASKRDVFAGEAARASEKVSS